jgi:hypothetical protein
MTAAVLFAGCTEESASPRAATAGINTPDLSVVSFAQRGRTDVRRDEPLVVVFSDELDPDSISPGSVRLIRRRGSREQPITAEVTGERLTLHPPEPFGFEGGERYWLVIDGFPSLRAPRCRHGQALDRRYRASFGTSEFYRPETIPPTVKAVTLGDEPGLGLKVVIEFSEPIDPASVTPGSTLFIETVPGGETVPGRLIVDRHAEVFRFLPSPGLRISAVRVTLTSGIVDLAGNPLRLESEEPFVLGLPEPPGALPTFDRAPVGEIAEDFRSDRMMDPAGTTALWNDPSVPGVLLGSPARITQLVPGNPAEAEEWVGIGNEPVEIRLILTREELGPARELTGLLFTTPERSRTHARYEGVTVQITPTDRRRLRDSGPDAGPPVTVLAEPEYGVESDIEDMVPLPFAHPYRYDGQTNLLLSIRIGPGDRTNFFMARRTGRGEGTVRRGRRTDPLRPVLSLRGFSLRPTAMSWFYDSGSENPEYFPAYVHPRAMPRGVSMTIEYQGAHFLLPDGRTPADPADLSDWVTDPVLLSGYRYLRFRVTFRGGSLTGEVPVLDDVVVPLLR